MAQMTFDKGSIRRVIIEGCRGDVRVEGGDHDLVELNGDRSLTGRVTETSGQLTIRQYNGDLRLRVGLETTIVGQRLMGDISVEHVAVLELDRVAGDLTVEDVGAFRVDDVGGDINLELRDGAAHVGRVGGDLRVSRASSLQAVTVGGDVHAELGHGPVQVDRIGGDCHVENASTVQIGGIGGDAVLTGVEQVLALGRVGGDLRLEWSGGFAGPIATTVGGDTQLDITVDPSFVLRAKVHGSISGDGSLPMNAGETREAGDEAATEAHGSKQGWDFDGGGELVATFGDGGAQWELTVGGDLDVHGGRVTQAEFHGEREPEFHFDDFGLGDEMRRLGREMKSMGRELARELRTAHTTPGGHPRFHMQINDKAFHFDADQIDRITREAREAAAAGVARAQEAVERALVNIVSGGRSSMPPVPGRAPRAPRPPRGPAGPRPFSSFTGQTVRIEREAPQGEPQRTDEEIQAEKLAILRMVGEGRLPVDEAEVMLRALDGRG